jgi:hypothetical protein
VCVCVCVCSYCDGDIYSSAFHLQVFIC